MKEVISYQLSVIRQNVILNWFQDLIMSRALLRIRLPRRFTPRNDDLIDSGVALLPRMTAFFLLLPFYFLLAKPVAAVDLAKEYGFGNIQSLGEGFTYLVRPGFSIAAVAVVLYFLFGSFKLLTSGGDKNNIAAGKDMIVHAIIGFVLLIMMFLILQFLPRLFGIELRVIGPSL